MAARVGAVLEMVATLVSDSRPSRPTATPTRAVSSGIPAADSEPKVTASTARATTTPTASLACPPFFAPPP